MPEVPLTVSLVTILVAGKSIAYFKEEKANNNQPLRIGFKAYI
jgi:hypothetical protein